jgi:hypothetical protein
MKAGTILDGGIYLRWTAFQQFMGEMALLSIHGQSQQVGTGALNLHRAKADRRLSDRTIAEILIGVRAIARRRGTKPPTFEELFDVRMLDRLA